MRVSCCACLLALVAACTPDEYDPAPPRDGGVFVDGYVDPALGVRIAFTRWTPFRDGVNEPPDVVYVDEVESYLVNDAGDSVRLVPMGRGVHVDTTSAIEPGRRYAIVARFGDQVVHTTSTLIPPAPRLRYTSAASFGTVLDEDFDIVLPVAAEPDPGYALKFRGVPTEGIEISYCNQQYDADLISAECRELFPAATFTAGWFSSFATADTLRTPVSNVTDAYADYVGILALNRTNDPLSTFIFIDPNVLPTNLENALGFVSFQNTTVVEVRRP